MQANHHFYTNTREKISSEINCRLPTLSEVIHCRTLAPVDLFSFYVYMRDVQQAAEILDFWLDVHQHKILCNYFTSEAAGSSIKAAPFSKAAITATEESFNGNSCLPSQFQLSECNNSKGWITKYGPNIILPTVIKSFEYCCSKLYSMYDHMGIKSQHYKTTMRSSNVIMCTIAPRKLPTDQLVLQESAKRILCNFLLPGAEQEITLPFGLHREIVQAVEQNGLYGHEIFDASEKYIFQIMERDYYPGFLCWRALGNLSPFGKTFRLVMGLLLLLMANWAGFSLILLGYSRRSRCWLICPLFFGLYLLTSYSFALDPVYALLGLSEYRLFTFLRIHESYIKKNLLERSCHVLTLVCCETLLCSCLVILVPSAHI